MPEQEIKTQEVQTAEEQNAETYAKIISGEVSLTDTAGKESNVNPKDEQANPQPQEPEETLETYKEKSQKEIERLNKIAKDNQAEFTRRSQELANTKAQLAKLQEELETLRKPKEEPSEDIDLSALEDYPEEVKKLFKNISEQNKKLSNKLKDVDNFVDAEKKRRISDDEQRQKLQELQQDFSNNILPEIIKEVPDYDAFMRANFQGYQEWANTLSEGERFSFLNSKDPRDLIRGVKEYKKFLNLPYEQEAIKLNKKENETKTGLYSTNKPANRTVPQSAPQISEREAWEQEIARQAEEYRQGRK